MTLCSQAPLQRAGGIAHHNRARYFVMLGEIGKTDGSNPGENGGGRIGKEDDLAVGLASCGYDFAAKAAGAEDGQSVHPRRLSAADSGCKP